MLLPGDKCNLPVVRSTQRDNAYYLGQQFMRKHVIVFDNSHRDERNENYMTIGLGLKNLKAIDKAILKQYDETVEGFKHSKEDSSVSTIEQDPDDVDGLQAELETIQHETENIRNGLTEFGKVYEQTKEAMKNVTLRNNELQQEMEDAKKAHIDIAARRTELAQSYRVLAKNLSDVMSEADVLKMEMAQLKDENKELDSNQKELKIQEGNLTEVYNAVKNNSTSFDSDPRYVKLYEQLETMKANLKRVQDNNSKMKYLIKHPKQVKPVVPETPTDDADKAPAFGLNLKYFSYLFRKFFDPLGILKLIGL